MAFGSRRAGCRVESALGYEALPTSCRQFPRILLADGRGWHQTLSLWCGTAAALVVGGATPLDAAAKDADDFLSFDYINADPRVHVESLDARGAWPPLLRPGVLAGLGAYGAWEARALRDWLTQAASGQERLGRVLLDLLRWTSWVRDWRSADDDLSSRLQQPWPSFPHTSNSGERPRHVDVLVNDLMSSVPEPCRPAAWPHGVVDADLGGPQIGQACADAALARYVATRLIGSWVAYQGEGLRSVVASLVVAYAVAVEALSRLDVAPLTLGCLTTAIRASDWLLLHLVDRADLAARCSGAENEDGAMDLVALLRASEATGDALPWAP